MEVLRFKKKGLWNSLVAALLYFPFFYFWYSVELYLWVTFQPQIRSISQTLIVTVGASLLHTVTALACLAFLLPTYMGYSTWLDKYRVPVHIVLRVGQQTVDVVEVQLVNNEAEDGDGSHSFTFPLLPVGNVNWVLEVGNVLR